MNDRDIAKQFVRSAVVAALLTDPQKIIAFLDNFARDIARRVPDKASIESMMALLQEAAMEAEAEIVKLTPVSTLTSDMETKGNG